MHDPSTVEEAAARAAPAATRPGPTVPERFGPARHVHPSLDDLLAGATVREPFDGTADGRSGATFERVELDGVAYVVKHVDRADDWTMRAMGDLAGVTLQLWRRGVLDALPPCINQPVVAVAKDPALPAGRGIALVMHDVGRWLVPPGDDPLPLAQHLGFLDHMAAVQAAFWEAGPEIDLVPVTNRYLDLSPWLAATEAAIGSTAAIPPLVARGWDALPAVAPALADVVLPLAWDPSRLAAGFATTPSTLLHGNWKVGNLGTDDVGRTVVLDWEGSGRGPACGELAWYLAINSARLPQSKEDAIAAYRAALERHGVATAPWWDRQLGLALVGGMVHFGWEKALGGPGPELDWWTSAVLAAGTAPPVSGDVTSYGGAVRTAYDEVAATWATGPGPVYVALAEALVGASPLPVAGADALDLGAGTGIASRVLVRGGAHVAAVDVAAAMLVVDRVDRPPAVVADAGALPFAAGRFDLAVAACSLTHVPDPVVGLQEVARVLRPGGVVLANAFVPGWSHPAKAAVDAVLARHGWEDPAWYVRFKTQLEPRLGRVADGRALAVAAGFAPGDVRVDEVAVDVGLERAVDLVAWRLGLANVAPFLAALPSGERAAVAAEALAAVEPVAGPLRPQVAVLVARAGGRSA